MKGVLLPSGLLALSKNHERVPYRNPALGVELPDADYEAEQPLSVDEARRLFAATDPARFGE